MSYLTRGATLPRKMLMSILHIHKAVNYEGIFSDFFAYLLLRTV